MSGAGDLISILPSPPTNPAYRQIIVANDGSTDGTQRAIDHGASRHDPSLVVVESPINLGKGAAIRSGLKHATGAIVLTQDADLELDPNEYGRLLAPILNEGAHVVYGSRFLQSNPSISRRTHLANRALTELTNLLFLSRLYKAFRRDVLQKIRLRCVGFDFEPELTAKLLLAGYHIVEVPIGYAPRRVDEGKKIRAINGLDAAYVLLNAG